MSQYVRDLRSGSAILVSKETDKVAAIFHVSQYKDEDAMRKACNTKWDELDGINLNESNLLTA